MIRSYLSSAASLNVAFKEVRTITLLGLGLGDLHAFVRLSNNLPDIAKVFLRLFKRVPPRR